MESLFQNFASWINGLPNWMAYTLIVFALLIWAFKDALSDKIKGFNFSSLIWWRQETDFQKLKNHDLFIVIEQVRDEVKNSRIMERRKFDVAKTKMCIDFANHKLDSIKSHFTDMLDMDLGKMGTEELRAVIFKQITACSILYMENSKKTWMDRGIKKDDVDYVLSLFDEYRHDVIKAFTARINYVLTSEFHETNFEKVLACYEVFAMAVDLLPRDLIDTFESLNGRFKEIQY